MSALVSLRGDHAGQRQARRAAARTGAGNPPPSAGRRADLSARTKLPTAASAFSPPKSCAKKFSAFSGDEIPYSISVEIEKFETEGKLRRIFAAIIVDRDSQKPILIGKKGEKLKEIGTQARKDMEELFDGKVYLEVWVKVKSGWADDERAVKSLGYE